MPSERRRIELATEEALQRLGLDAALAIVRRSDRPDLADYQCNAAMAAGKALKRPPRDVASEIEAALVPALGDVEISIAGPGFLNFRLGGARLAGALNAMASDPARLGADPAARALEIVMDYGGPNIAKHMHVGHVRSSVIGEAIKRLARFQGHRVTGDIHLGDWGLQMGMVLFGISEKWPGLPYFDAARTGPYPEQSPVTLDDLEAIYPDIAARAAKDAAVREAAGQMTVELQRGREGYRALWRHIENVSLEEIRRGMDRLGVTFEQWFGESRYQARIPGLVRELKDRGIAVENEGALIIPVAEPTDTKEMPPVIVQSSRGGDLYHTTDLATIEERVRTYGAELILYVVDNRQSLHFEQLFRAAARIGLAEHTRFEHLAFGTMNGVDGKPFKTRAGGVVRLKDLIDSLVDAAATRLSESGRFEPGSEAFARTAEQVGVATLKFADLQHDRKSNYIFDPDKFSRFEGKTGPYLQYTAVRIKSILEKAAQEGLAIGPIALTGAKEERALGAALVRFGDEAASAFDLRAPHLFCDYIFEVAQAFSQFYHATHILGEADPAARASHLGLAALTLRALETGLHLLGIEVPAKM